MGLLRFEIIKKRWFLSNVLYLGRQFWCTKGRQFVNLYYIIFISFSKKFAPISSWVRVFIIFGVFCSGYLLSFFAFQINSEALKRLGIY